MTIADTLTAHLTRLAACDEATRWARGKSLAVAWRTCPRGDWLLWLAVRAGVRRETLVLAACDCARTALRYVPAGEDRPRLAVETAERWARGEASIAEVRVAATAAYAAYAAADAATAAYAADAAAYAASAADAAAYANDAAASAAYAATADRARSQRECARLVRRRISWRDVAAALEDYK